MNRFWIVLLLLSLAVPVTLSAAEHGHGDENDSAQAEEADEEGGHDTESAAAADLSVAQMQMAGIETVLVREQLLGAAIAAPGEVRLNAYRTSKVTPRIAAQVIRRHVRLGDKVRQGQPLVSLSSVAMAEAQGGLMKASVEWRRVKNLGRKVVSEKRFVTAQITYQQAVARVRAYGMTKAQVTSLLKMGDAAQATGEFQLLSAQRGTVISDDFVVGELIEAGQLLMAISDESLLWVEAQLTPEDARQIALSAPVRVQAGQRWLSGQVVQASHTLDEKTRTLAIQIEVANPDDDLHPGQFVTTIIESSKKDKGIVVPLAAVLRSPDGDWQVFVETSDGRFEGHEIEVLRTVGDRVLIEGLVTGTTIVSQGAFFVQSEIAKSGFSVHNH